MHTAARILAPLLLTLGLLAGHGAAQAVEASPAHTPEPAIAYPLTNPDGTVAHRVRLDAAPRTWRIKVAARHYDAAIPGLTIETGPCLPDVPCIRVSVGTYDEAAMVAIAGPQAPYWAGLTTFPEANVRHVLLNRAEQSRISGGRLRVASHELGHALGLSHHDQPRGLMCVPPARCDIALWEWEPTLNELAPLTAYYAQELTA